MGPIPMTNKSVPPSEYGPGKANSDADWNLVGYTVNSNCTLNDFLQLFVNLFSWGMYMISILGMLMLFVGGGTMLMSGGSEERVRKGKAILTNTIFGIVIALGSWLIINTLYVALLPEGSTKNGVAYILDNQPWFRTSSSKTWGSCSEPPQSPCKGGPGAETVRIVQTKMYNQGCYLNPGTLEQEVDGSFGPKTLAAWKFWQQMNGVTPSETMSGYESLIVPCNIMDFL